VKTTAAIPVRMPDGSIYPVGKLLSDRNFKLEKSNNADRGFYTYGLSMAPSTIGGPDVCAFASEQCRAACLFTAGRGSMSSVYNGRLAKKLAFFQHKADFLDKLHTELHSAEQIVSRYDLRLAVRPNVISDLPWERIDPTLFSDHPNVQWYDYTKRPGRVVPANYDLTFSRSEDNEAIALQEYAAGRNVAVVFSVTDPADLPKTWNGIRVFSGDSTDLRFLDKRGIVGLTAKGKAIANGGSFTVPVLRRYRRVA